MSFSLTRFVLQMGTLSISQAWEMTKVKRAHILANPQCEICGSRQVLEAHHIRPLHLFPELYCNPLNFVTLCDYGNKGCHLKFGHLGMFTNYNPDIQALIVNIRTFYKEHNLKIKFDKEFIINNI